MTGSPPLLLTPGEPAGIGPEIALKAALESPGLVLLANAELLGATSARFGQKVELRLISEPGQARCKAGAVNLIDFELATPVVPGQLDPINARYVLETLDAACGWCLSGKAAGLVTGPVHKAVINEAGIPFSGHTEHLARAAGDVPVVMMLVADKLRVALATTHLPLAAVPAAINAERLEQTLTIIDADLKHRFCIARPRIMVLGLNPHAGEGGHLGREEIEIISPVIERLRARGMNLQGPVPADTGFVPQRLAECDAVLAMYHDQGLPVLKHAGFGEAVNVTLGLPFIRTSVDHGTALDLAGTGQAEASSLLAAIRLAEILR